MSYDYAHLFAEGRKIVTERMETIQIERSPLDQFGKAATSAKPSQDAPSWQSAWRRPSTAPAGDLQAFAVPKPSDPASAKTLAAAAYRRAVDDDEAATAASWKKALAQKYAAAMEASNLSTTVTPATPATPASSGAALSWGKAALTKKYEAAAAAPAAEAAAAEAGGGGGGGGGGFAGLVAGAGGGFGGLMRALAAKKFARKYRKDRNITDKKQKLLDSFDFSLHERIHCGYNQLSNIVAHVRKHTTRIRHAAARGGTSTRLPPHVVAERARLKRMRRDRRTKCPEVDLPMSIKMHNDVHTIRGFAKAFAGHEELLHKATASVQTKLPDHVRRERKRYVRIQASSRTRPTFHRSP